MLGGGVCGGAVDGDGVSGGESGLMGRKRLRQF